MIARTSAKRLPGDPNSGMPKDRWTSGTRNKLLRKDNEAEKYVRWLLRKSYVTFHRERPIEVGGKRYFIDFMVVSFKENRKHIRVAVEVDGGYHFTDEQRAIDRKKDSDLLMCPRVWSVLRIGAAVAMNMKPDVMGQRRIRPTQSPRSEKYNRTRPG